MIKKVFTVLLSSITVTLEMEPKLKYIVLELTAKSVLMSKLPFSVDNFEGNVLQNKINKNINSRITNSTIHQ